MILQPQPTERDPRAVIRPTLDDLIRLGKPARLIRLARPTARALQSGQYLAHFKGRGMEFDEARPYSHGDDIRSLDWRVTARTGKVHTKLFREERERPIFLSVDLRAAMFFATRGMYKSALAARLAALIAWSSLHHGDRLGGQIITGTHRHAFMPTEGHASVLRVLKHLADECEQGPTSETRAELFDQSLVELQRHVRPGSLVFVLSDFRGLKETGCAALGRTARHSTVVLLAISDLIERDLPAGIHRYGRPGQERMLQGDEKTRLAHLANFESRIGRIKTLSQTYHMKMVQAWTHEAPVLILNRAFNLSRNRASGPK